MIGKYKGHYENSFFFSAMWVPFIEFVWCGFGRMDWTKAISFQNN